jgi:hypothetical protein
MGRRSSLVLWAGFTDSPDRTYVPWGHGWSRYCKGAHFPEGIEAKECNCHTHTKEHPNATKIEKCQGGWPDQEYYVPHSSGSKTADGHWNDKKRVAKKKYSFQHADEA